MIIPVRDCLWLEEVRAGGGPRFAPLAGEVAADVCVVGGGYTGLWTALRVLELEPAASVVVVEGRSCGWAASGRNGGFALSWWPKLPSLIKRCGEEEAVRLARASAAAVGEIGALGVDVGFRRAGWHWTATSEAQMGAWEDAVAACARAGATPFEPRAGGVFEPGAATVQPARLARGLTQLAAERGARVFERSPALEVDRERGVVRTPGGAVRADAVVLATNAWLVGVPELRRSLAVVSSDVVASEPVPGALPGGEAVSDSRLMVRYWRSTADGRVVLGRGGGALALGARFAGFHSPPARRVDPVVRELPLLVPEARGARVTHAWGGAVDRSVDGLPFFGLLPGRARVAYGAGFSGNGVGPSLIGGRVLASLALRRDDGWSGCGLARGVPAQRFPPEPVRFFGGALVRRAVGRKERVETAGGRAGPVARGLAALAPRGR